MTINYEIDRIRALPKVQRLAGYLARLAALDEVGARFRTNKEDEEWTEEEHNEWDKYCDELDPWWYALSEEEKCSVNYVENYMACLCRGELPEEQYPRFKEQYLVAEEYYKNLALGYIKNKTENKV